ncbi:MAG: RDD family protein [Ginsengibacter sp.]
MPIVNNDSSLLTEFETTYVKASAGKRFANYIIDLIFFYIFLIGGLVFFPGLFSLIGRGSTYELLFQLAALLFFVVLMFVQEALFNGKTIGKFITKTRALKDDGSKMSAGVALGRAFCRAVPFEPFSAFGSPPNPWHDKWTKTMVIDEKQTTELSINID